jgi:hypothetical protein
MSVDAIIVGSGPGGATAADILTRAGWTVTIIEKGRNHLIDPDDPSKLVQDYSNDEIKFMHRHFLGPDPLIEPRTFRISEEDGEHSYVGAVNSIPSTVGGGGTHADGKVPRFRPEDFRLHSTYGPIEGAAVADWPVDYDELEPYYAEVERLIGVAGTAGANPFAAWRSGPYPMPSGAPMYGAVLSSAAAEREGLHPYPGPTAANSIPYDGRPACNNCGHCAYFGCPIHAKGDPVAMLQHALGTGRAELLSETFVSRIRTNGREASGVDVIGPDGVERSLGARYVIVAGGAIETPRLLLLSGIEHPLIGRHLMMHFQTMNVGIMPQRLHAHMGRSVTHLHDDCMLVDDDALDAARARRDCRGSAAAWWSMGEAGTPSWRANSTRGGLPTRSSWRRRLCATGCGRSSCRGRICPSPPIASISTRPSAMCGAFLRPGSRSNHTAMSSWRRPITDRATYGCSKTWAPHGRRRRRHLWSKAPPSGRRSPPATATTPPTTAARYRPFPPVATSWGRRAWGPTRPRRWWTGLAACTICPTSWWPIRRFS